MFSKTVCGNPAAETTDKKGGQQMIKILVNEIFGPTIQGEGKSAGKEVMFLRTSGCNLACIWCDTPYTWNWKGTKFQHPDKYDPKKESHQMSIDEIVGKLKIKSLVISGGEPLLQQDKITALLERLKSEEFWTECETNGTIEPNDRFFELIDQINCSPKLSNSGPDNPEFKRINPRALLKLAHSPKTTFKFVVATENDLGEINDLVKQYGLKNVYLMPEGRTREEQEARSAEVERYCKENGFNFTPRLHVLKWGTKRGV